VAAVVLHADVVGAAAAALIEAVGHLGGEGTDPGGAELLVDLTFVFGAAILG
jgi:hypothetical protein